MWLGLLGTLHVEHHDEIIPVPAAKQRVVLAALMMQPNRVVSVDELTDAVWGDNAPPAARATLRNYVKRLRQGLGPEMASRIKTRDPGYRIDLDEGELDLVQFTRLCGAGGAAVHAGLWERGGILLEEALDLWRGAPLSDVPSEALRRSEVPRLEQLRVQALEWHLEAQLHLGRHEEAVPQLQALTAQFPLRERLHGHLMLALYRCGRQADALTAYHGVRQVLVDELGVEPGAELQQLHQLILTADGCLRWAGGSHAPGGARPSGPAGSLAPGAAAVASAQVTAVRTPPRQPDPVQAPRPRLRPSAYDRCYRKNCQIESRWAMAPKAFASSADLTAKEQTLEILADGVYALTAEGDPNVGAIEGEDFLVCFEAMATPAAAREWLARLREHTDKPVRYLVLSHYHAVRVLGASAFGADVIVAHRKTRELIAERGQQDWESEYARMPRLFKEPASIPGLTWPTATFTDRFTIDLGGGRGDLELSYCGRGHTEGDIVAWLPRQRILFAGDLVEAQAALYTGDAFHRDWAAGTLDAVAALGARTLIGGRGAVAHGAEACAAAVGQTRHFLDTMLAEVGAVHRRGGTLAEAFGAAHGALAERYGRWPIFEHCMPFNVSRLWDELSGIERPRIWTAQRDREVWDELQG